MDGKGFAGRRIDRDPLDGREWTPEDELVLAVVVVGRLRVVLRARLPVGRGVGSSVVLRRIGLNPIRMSRPSFTVS